MKHSEKFLIFAGGSRSGSNAVYYYLEQHPQACMTRKTEVHFFSFPCMKGDNAGPGDAIELAEMPTTFDEFMGSFRPYTPGQIRVNISPSLLFHSGCAENILRHLDDVRIVFMLRNPIEKAFSHYLHMTGEGREHLSFEEGLALEDERARKGFSDGFLYRRNGRYFEALMRFHQLFGDNMKVLLLDDFLSEPLLTMEHLCAFGGLDPSFPFRRIGMVNRAGTPRFPLLGRLMGPNPLTFALRKVIPPETGRRVRSAIRDWNTGPKPRMSAEARELIVDYVREDVRRLEEWLGRSTGWIEESTN